MRPFFCAFLLLFLLNGCGRRQAEKSGAVATGILGGQEIRDGDPQFTFLAALRLKNSPDATHCSASLISPKVLVTAAHCLYGDRGLLNPSDFEVVFSTESRSRASSRIRTVKDFKIYPGYIHSKPEDACAFGPCPPSDDFGEWLPHDLALMVLETLAPEGANPLSVAKQNFPFKEGLAVSIAGYGFNVPLNEIGNDPSQSGKAKTLSTVLNLKLNDHDTRGEFHKLYVRNFAGEGACFGDSGGPLLSNIRGFPFLLGVLSHSAQLENGFGCGNHSSAYTDITFHQPWIEEFLKEQQ